jgi:hypothetical protein
LGEAPQNKEEGCGGWQPPKGGFRGRVFVEIRSTLEQTWSVKSNQHEASTNVCNFNVIWDVWLGRRSIRPCCAFMSQHGAVVHTENEAPSLHRRCPKTRWVQTANVTPFLAGTTTLQNKLNSAMALEPPATWTQMDHIYAARERDSSFTLKAIVAETFEIKVKYRQRP